MKVWIFLASFLALTSSAFALTLEVDVPTAKADALYNALVEFNYIKAPTENATQADKKADIEGAIREQLKEYYVASEKKIASVAASQAAEAQARLTF